MEYPQTAGTGDGLSQCSTVQHHTCDQNTVGIPVPVKYPNDIIDKELHGTGDRQGTGRISVENGHRKED